MIIPTPDMERVADTTEYEGKNFTSSAFAGTNILIFSECHKQFGVDAAIILNF